MNIDKLTNLDDSIVMNMLRSPRLFFSRTPLIVRTVLAYSFLIGITTGVSILVRQAEAIPVAVVAYTQPLKIGVAQRVVQGAPLRIQVDRLDIDLPINEGTYDAKTGEWTLSESAAYFATITDQPNDYKGSTFIYGHNRRSVFAPLAAIKAGDTVRITTNNHHSFTYTYLRDASIAPDMTSILYEHPEPPQLVLMTCEGVFSATRRIMYFTLTGVDA